MGAASLRLSRPLSFSLLRRRSLLRSRLRSFSSLSLVLRDEGRSFSSFSLVLRAEGRSFSSFSLMLRDEGRSSFLLRSGLRLRRSGLRLLRVGLRLLLRSGLRLLRVGLRLLLRSGLRFRFSGDRPRSLLLFRLLPSLLLDLRRERERSLLRRRSGAGSISLDSGGSWKRDR